MSEKEIRQHYANREVKPTYFIIRNDSVKLFCATTGADTLPPLLLIHVVPERGRALDAEVGGDSHLVAHALIRLLRALIDTAALRHNLGTIRAYAPGSKVMTAAAPPTALRIRKLRRSTPGGISCAINRLVSASGSSVCLSSGF